jgi:cyclopropane-fatty-acyl-phospholipid synthase
VESLREHYPFTLRRWLANLQAHSPEAVALVGAERERAWRLYILASAQGFEDGEISVYQVLAARLGSDHELPLTRADLLATRGSRLPGPPDAPPPRTPAPSNAPEELIASGD